MSGPTLRGQGEDLADFMLSSDDCAIIRLSESRNIRTSEYPSPVPTRVSRQLAGTLRNPNALPVNAESLLHPSC